MVEKIIIAPTLQIAKSWGYSQFDDRYRIITRRDRYMGVTRKLDMYIFIDGKEFDYPPLTEEYVELKKEVLQRCF